MADVNVKMGVSGVAQFKQGMKQAQQSAKTLAAQMKANESQYKATGDREQYLAEKSKLLKAQLEAQKKAAKNAEQALDAMRKNGVEKTSAEYQKMEQALAGAKAAMFDAQAAMNGLYTSETKVSKGATEVTDSLNSIAKKVSLDAVVTGIDKITGAMEKAGKKAVEVGGQIWSNIMDSAEYADGIATLAATTQTSIQTIEQMNYVAARFEAPAEMMAKSWHKVRLNMASDSEEIAKGFEQLGVATHEMTYGKYGWVKGEARDFQDVFWETGEAIMQMTDRAEQDRLATLLLGRNWEDLITLFTKGRKQYDEAMADAPVNTEKAVESMGDLNDRVKELEVQWQYLKIEAISAIAPALEEAVKKLQGIFNQIIEYLQTPEGQKAMEDIGNSISNLLDNITSIEPSEIVEKFKQALQAIEEGLQWIEDNQTLVETALIVIGGGFAAVKIGEFALSIGKIVSGFETLWKGADKKLPQIPTIDGNGGGGGGTTGTQSVGTQTVTTQNVTTGKFVEAKTASETVTTMYVENMVGGPNGSPNIPKVHTDIPKIGTDDIIKLNAASGGALTSGTGYNLTAGGVPKLNAAEETIKIDAGSTRILLGDGTEIETAGPIRMDGMINAGTGKVIADGAFDAFGQQFAATHPLADKVINTVFSPQGLATLGVIAGIPLIAQASKYLDTRAAGVEKFGEGYKGLTHRQKKIADGNAPLDNGNYENIDDVKAAAEKQKKIDKALMPEWLRWTVDLSDAVDNTADAIAGTAAEIYNIGKEAVNLPFDVLNAAIFGDSNKGQMVIDMAGMLLGGAAQKTSGFFGAVGKIADTVGGVAEKKAQTWAIEMAGTVAQDFINPMKQSINDVFAKIYQLKVQLTPAGDSKFGYFSPTSGGGTTTWFSRLVGTTSSMHANGLPYVPHDNYFSILHRGERVMTARENANYTYNSNNYFGAVNLNNGLEIEALTESLNRRNRRQRAGYGA